MALFPDEKCPLLQFFALLMKVDLRNRKEAKIKRDLVRVISLIRDLHKTVR